MKTMKKGTALGILGLFYTSIFIIIFFIQYKPQLTEEDKHQHAMYVNDWYESEVVVYFTNGDIDTMNLKVHESADNLEVEDGNLRYWKPMSHGASKIKVASYVQKFEVTNSILHPDTFKYDCWAEHE